MAYVTPTPNTTPNIDLGTVDVTLDNTMSLATIKSKISAAGEGATIFWAGAGANYLLNGSLGGFKSGQKHFGTQGNPPKLKCTAGGNIASFVGLKQGTGGVPSTDVTISDIEFWGHTNVPSKPPASAPVAILVPWLNTFLRRVALKGGESGGLKLQGDRVELHIMVDTCELAYNSATGSTGADAGMKVHQVGVCGTPLGAGMTVQCTEVHHNWLNGLWTDISSNGIQFLANNIHDNAAAGIHLETCGGPFLVRDNIVQRNGGGGDIPASSSVTQGIRVISCDNGQILNNTLGSNAGPGIYFIEDQDPASRTSMHCPTVGNAGDGYFFADWDVIGNVLNGDTVNSVVTTDPAITYSTAHYTDPGGGGGGGTITVAEQVETVDATNGTSYTSGSFTPPANSLLVCHFSGAAVVGNTLSGTITAASSGYTWTPLSGMPVRKSSNDFEVRAWWTTTGASPASMTVTISGYAQNLTSGITEVLAFSGADLAAPTQVTVNNTGAVRPDTDLAATPDATSAVVMVNQIVRNPPGWTAEAGWTQHTSVASDQANGLSIWSKTGDGSFTATGTNGASWGFIYEVATTTASPVTVTVNPAVEVDSAFPFVASIPQGLSNPYVIEADFTTPLLDPPGTWTDITAFVRGFDTRRGRNHELGQMQAGEATLTLDNRDRRFDPSNTSSPYYPNVVPMRHMRIRANHQGVVYDLFAGFVEDWGQQWSGPNAAGAGDATCEVQLVDAFKLLNLADLTTYEAEVLQDDPMVCWPMDDDPTAVLTDTMGAAPLTTKLGDASFLTAGSVEGPLRGATTAVTYLGDTNALWQTDALTDEAFRIKGDVTVEMWAYLPTAFNFNGLMQIAFFQNANQRMAFTVNGQRKMGANVQDENGNFPALTLGTAFTADAWHHLAWVRSGSTIYFYIDGVEAIHARLPLAAWGGGDVTLIADWGEIGGQLSGGGARMSHVCIYSHPLTAQRIATHAAVTMGPIDQGQRVDTGITYILDAVGWPSTQRTIGASGHTVSKHVPDPNALSAIQTLAEKTDGGLFFVGADGTLVFLSSDDLREAPTPLAGWQDQTTDLRYSGLVLRNDDNDLFPEVRASAEGLPDAVATDAAGMDRYGRRTLDADSGVLGTVAQLVDRANGYLGRYHVPRTRAESLTALSNPTYPGRLAEQFSSEIGRKVQITRHPPGGGTLTLTAIIEGVSHSSIEQMTQIQTVLNLAPAEDTPWILEDPTYGVLGETTPLGW